MMRSFDALAPVEALHVAIFIEERNAELYHQFAEMFVEFHDLDSLEIAGVFWDMALEEKRHSTLLQNRFTELYGNAACAITEEQIHEIIELPRLEDGDVFGASPEPSNPRKAALEVAYRAECGAQEFYKKLSEQNSEPTLRRLYMELAGFENSHVRFLERKLAEASQPAHPPAQ